MAQPVQLGYLAWQKPNRIIRVTMMASLAIHVVGAAVFVVRGFWNIERVESKRVPVVFALPALPSSPAMASAKPASAPKARAQSKKARTLEQPVRDVQPIHQQVAHSTATISSEQVGDGNRGEPGDGSASSECVGPDCEGTGEGPPVPAADEAEPIQIAMQMIQGQMIAGQREIPLPASVLSQVSAQGLDRVTARLFLCISDTGDFRSLKWLSGTGYPDADARIEHETRKWRFRPWVANGHPVSACFSVVFKYNILR